MSPTTTQPKSGETPSTTAFAAIDAGKPRFARLRGSLQQLLAFASLIVILVVFSFLSPHFFTPNNLVSILMAATVTGILALGTTFVIITGGIDLSIGTGMILCGVMAGVFLTYLGWPLWAGVLATVLFGGLIGLVNGFNISVFGIPPFIATLGMMLIAAGLSLVISGTKPIYFKETPDFQSLMNFSMIPGMRFPLGVAIFIVLIVVAAVLLAKTIVGRYTFSIGATRPPPRSRASTSPLEDHHLHDRRPVRRDRRRAGRLAPLIGAAGRRHGARTRGDRGRGHRRHLAAGREGLDHRNGDRRAHHGRPHQRPARHLGAAGMAVGRGRLRHPRGRLPRHAASTTRLTTRIAPPAPSNEYPHNTKE